jgi:hypothetical protein
MEIRYVDPRYLGQMVKAVFAGFVPQLLKSIDEGGQQLFAVPEEHYIEKWGQRFGVGCQYGSATEHDWILITTLMAPEGNPLLFKEV